MHALAWPKWEAAATVARASRAQNKSASDRPNRLRPPTWSRSRRLSRSQRVFRESRRRIIRSLGLWVVAGNRDAGVQYGKMFWDRQDTAPSCRSLRGFSGEECPSESGAWHDGAVDWHVRCKEGSD